MSSKSVLEHFTVPDDFQNGNTFKGKCMHCGTLISGSYKVTSNFVTHMKLEMTNALIMFIAGDLLPLSIVESEEFKNLMEKADTKYQVPSRKHLSSKLLHEKSVEIKNNLVNTLKRAESVCLTIDLWSSRQMRGFLGITGHFILDWAMKSVMICCKRFKGRHTAESIRSEYEEVVTSFEHIIE
ncbi:Hypothetical predicted protein [Mytilus galloprovincialis]|uniref:BED-type domain-containing protein n=1 Tax=Mytilus galloprovincialis TaxID=29158 RepID=A0A8B6F9Y9_MYTGA|nr:Hypothetical predicted protein [Mytilus galloprovincialis]